MIKRLFYGYIILELLSTALTFRGIDNDFCQKDLYSIGVYCCKVSLR